MTQPRQESSAIFARLLTGEATSEEYVDALKREIRQERRDYPLRVYPTGEWVDKLARQVAMWQWLAFAGWVACLLVTFAAAMGWL